MNDKIKQKKVWWAGWRLRGGTFQHVDSLVTNHRSASDCSSNDVYRYLEYLHDVRIVLCIDLIKLFFLNSHLLGRFDT